MIGLIVQKAVQLLIVVGIDNCGPGHRKEENSTIAAMADAPQKLSAFMNAEVVPLIDRRFERSVTDLTEELVERR
jgi:enterochelin esterase-like enzyme